MGQGRLLDRKERFHLMAAGADDADRARNDEADQIDCDRKREAGQHHQDGSHHEHPSPTDPVCACHQV
jgi:hypothetical protein